MLIAASSQALAEFCGSFVCQHFAADDILKDGDPHFKIALDDESISYFNFCEA